MSGYEVVGPDGVARKYDRPSTTCEVQPMTGLARRWRNGYWRVKFDNGLDLYPITTEELARVQRHHDVTVRNGRWAR